MRAFRVVTDLIAAALVISALLHVVLLASDSAEYRRWVCLQMVLLLVGAWLLWHVRKFRLGALVAFAMLSALGIYINAVPINYGNGPVIWLAPLIGWCLYGGLAFFAQIDRTRVVVVKRVLVSVVYRSGGLLQKLTL